jgi:hypothetical protein
MNKRKVAALAASVAVVLGVAVTSWLMRGPQADAPTTSGSPPETEMVVLNLHATGDVDTRVTHTCVEAGSVSTCHASVRGGVWSTKVTVPAGTTVHVQARDGVLTPWCSIADVEDQALIRDQSGGTCEWVAGQ